MLFLFSLSILTTYTSISQFQLLQYLQVKKQGPMIIENMNQSISSTYINKCTKCRYSNYSSFQDVPNLKSFTLTLFLLSSFLLKNCFFRKNSSISSLFKFKNFECNFHANKTILAFSFWVQIIL